MLSSLGNIVVIGLSTREDRWARCEEIFNREGFSEVTRYVTEYDSDDTHRKCTEDFLRVLQDNRGENLVFFEDDFELVDGWREVFIRAWNELPDKWDMFYLGCNLTKKPKRKTNNLYLIRGAWMLHTVIMHRDWIDYILNNYDINKVVCFDEWCRQIAEQRRFYMCYPMVAYQRDGYSDFERKYVSYDIFNNRFYRHL